MLNDSFTGMTWDTYVHRTIPESEFTLAAYGLPDVYKPEDSSPLLKPGYVLIGASILFMLIAIVLYRWSKQR